MPMNFRRVLLGIVSIAVSVALIILIIRIGNIDLRSTWEAIARAKASALIKLVLLNILLVWLSTEKWRSVDAALRHASDPVPSWTAAFAFTSGGMALGQVLPVQLD